MPPLVPDAVLRNWQVAEVHIRDGRFQRSLAALAGVSSLVGGSEVAYEHYRAGYGQRVMFSPVLLSGAMTVAGLCGAFSPRAARTLLRWTSALTLLDCLIGFGFHVRGVQRKPGGWRLPVTNIIMGPPIFAPLLFGLSPALGLVASYLRPEETPAQPTHDRYTSDAGDAGWKNEIRAGRFQKHLAAVTLAGTFCSGAEALYSHYQNDFRYAAQWTPIVIAPLLMAAAGGAMVSPAMARTWLPATSVLAMAGGAAGVFYHGRGVMRRPGGLRKPLYNVIVGPPLFAPLLFAACGLVGLLASLMRRERT